MLKPNPNPVSLHAVTISFNYSLEDDEPFYSLVAELMEIIERKGLGIYDGHGMAEDNSAGDFFLYGPDATLLFNAVAPVLKSRPFMSGAVARLSFGTPGVAPEDKRIIL